MIILKLGGSLLTNKEKKFSINRRVLKRIASEIKACEENGKKLVVVHGGGAFGHPLAKEYELNRGYISKSQIKGIALTRKAMQDFNNLVVKEFIDQGINAIALQTSAIVTCENREIKSFNHEVVERFLELGLTPILYGDVVLDDKLKFCILSGDRIITHLAKILNPGRIVLATDVDGVFDKNPKKYKDAKLIEKITPEIFKRNRLNFESYANDVTGGIEYKVRELLSLAKLGYNTIIINAKIRGRLKKALLGHEVVGTRIEGE